MKQGRSLVELATELERQQESKRDFLADTRSLNMTAGADVLEIDNHDGFGNLDALGITDYCHQQIGLRLSIPKPYYDRMRTEAPKLLSRNVNHWFDGKPERRMVRTLDGKARAFLSDRYRPLDNFDLAQAVLPRISAAGCEVKSSELTERRLYIQAVTPKISGEIKKGDVVQAGLVVSNSEIGAGSVKIEPLIFILECTNGMIRADRSLRKYHIGRRNQGQNGLEFDGASEFFKDSTRRLDDKTFWAKVCDVVEGALDEVKFNEAIEELRSATEKRIENDPVKAVEVLSNQLVFNEDERGSVLRHLVEGGDLSAYGLSNAVTRTAEDIDSYDRAIEFERFGGRVIELPQKDWEAIAVKN